MNRILVLPQRLARALDLGVTSAIISIRDPGDYFAFPARWGQRGVLPLYFRDLEKFADEVAVIAMKGMTPEHARQAWAFIHEHADEIDTLVIHCFAGISRSAGMAEAVAACLGGVTIERAVQTDAQANQHVYRTMREAYPLEKT